MTDRKYLLVVLVAFSLLGLTVLGVCVYRPLRVWYAVRRIQDLGGGQDPSRPELSKWVSICAEAAADGSWPAMEALVDCRATKIPHLTSDTRASAAYTAVLIRPRLLFEVLDARDKVDALDFLGETAYDCYMFASTGSSDPQILEKIMAVTDWPEDTPFAGRVKGLATALDAIQAGARTDLRPAPYVEVATEAKQVAQQALEYLRRRFAKELAEADKKAGKGP